MGSIPVEGTKSSNQTILKPLKTRMFPSISGFCCLTAKAGRDRKIALPASTTAFFAEQAKDKLPTAPLIARANGQFWNKDAWKYPFKDAAKAANLPSAATAYALRHSTITDLIALHRLDTMTVAQLSGTSLQMIEKHYGHLLPSTLHLPHDFEIKPLNFPSSNRVNPPN